VRSNPISILPSSVVELRNLMCLDIDETTRVPNGIGNLTCLEQLSKLRIDGSTINIIEELGQLTELRLLRIELIEWNDKLLGCLHKLQKIQELHIAAYRWPRNIGGTSPFLGYRIRLLVFYTAYLGESIVCSGSQLPTDFREGATSGGSRHPREVASSPLSTAGGGQ